MWGQEQLRVKVVGTRGGKRSKLLRWWKRWRRRRRLKADTTVDEPRRGAPRLSSPTIQSSFLFISEHFSGRFNSSYLHVVSLLGFRFDFWVVDQTRLLSFSTSPDYRHHSTFSLDKHHSRQLSTAEKAKRLHTKLNFCVSCQAIKQPFQFSSFDHSRRAKGARRRQF